MIDPTGQTPDVPGIGKGDYTYSCNCGWIDWRHATPTLAGKILNFVDQSIVFFEDPANACEDYYIIPADQISHHTGFDIKLPVIPKYHQDVSTTKNDVAIPSGKGNRANRNQVAMGIFRWVQENLEDAQWLSQVGKWYDPKSGKLFDTNSSFNSYYTEEDLVSDLIGFYGAIHGYTADTEDYRRWVGLICHFPRDKTERQKLSLKTINEYPPFTTNKDWEHPILQSTPCIDAYCGRYRGSRSWPTEFKSIQPLPGGGLSITVFGLVVPLESQDKTWLVVNNPTPSRY